MVFNGLWHLGSIDFIFGFQEQDRCTWSESLVANPQWINLGGTSTLVMALSTFKQKVEERLKSGSPGDVSAGPPPAKKSCSTYEKQMQNLPPGNLDLVKEQSWILKSFKQVH